MWQPQRLSDATEVDQLVDQRSASHNLLRTAIIYTLETDEEELKLVVVSPERIKLAKIALDKTHASRTLVRKFA